MSLHEFKSCTTIFSDLTAIPLTITNIDSQLGFLLIQQKIEELVSRHTMVRVLKLDVATTI